MAARTEDHWNVPFSQEVIKDNYVVPPPDLVVDGLDARFFRGKQRNRVMHLIYPQEGRIANPIGNTGIANCGPKCIIANCIGCAGADMAEAGNAGVSGAKIASTRVSGTINKFNVVAAWVFER